MRKFVLFYDIDMSTYIGMEKVYLRWQTTNEEAKKMYESGLLNKKKLYLLILQMW